MADSARPRAPAGLQKAGRSLWKAMAADVAQGWELDARDRAQLGSACRLADAAALLEEVVERDGVMAKGSTGQPVVHPALIELRQHRAAIAALLARVELAPPEQRTGPMSARQRDQLRQARQARWAG